MYIGFLHDDSIISQNWENNLIKILNENFLVNAAGSITFNNTDEQSITIQKDKFNENIKDDEILRIERLIPLFYQSMDKINELINLKLQLPELEEIYNSLKLSFTKFQKIISKNGIQSLSDEEQINYKNIKLSFEASEKKLNDQNEKILNLNNELEEPFNDLNNLITSSFEQKDPIIYEQDFKIDKEPERQELTNKYDSSCKISLFGSIFKIEAFKEFGKFDEDLISTFRIEDEFCKRMILKNKFTALVASSFVSHKCKSFINNSTINNLFRNATLYNIDLKYSLNTENLKKPYVIYTCIFEGEKVPEFKNYDINNFEYLCFTNSDIIAGMSKIHSPWKFINITKFAKIMGFDYTDNESKMKMFFKYHPHFFFKNYNASIWFNPIDFPEIPSNLIDIIRLKNKDHIMLSLESTSFDCAYKELIYNFKNGILSENVYNEILNVYRKFRYPQNNGLIDTSFMIFKHNDESCKITLNQIWEFIKKYHSNDKLFANLCFWLNKKSYSTIYNSLFFNYILKDFE